MKDIVILGLVGWSLVALAACGGDATSTADAGMATNDSGEAPPIDAAAPRDSGRSGDDSGSTGDATTPRDAGIRTRDAGIEPDAGGTADAGGFECDSLHVCDAREYCDTAPGMCGSQSDCVPAIGIGVLCRTGGPVVCGCDGNTYMNDCYAHKAATPVDHEGACP